MLIREFNRSTITINIVIYYYPQKQSSHSHMMSLITKKKLTPEQITEAKKKRLEIKYRADVKAFFTNAGLDSINVNGKEIEFKGRTGELDNLFVKDNIVIVCEDTQAINSGHHLLKKKIIFDLIETYKHEFIEFLISTFPDFKALHLKSSFQFHHYIVKITYFSRNPIDKEHTNQCPTIFFFENPRLRYFVSLSKAIGKTARYELYKYLQIPYKSVGDACIKGSVSKSVTSYQGFLLPEANSNYPQGYKVLSFYIDPLTLLEKSYVLRKDGWEDPDATYQRMLEHKKIRSMRKYLYETNKVYVNNLIVTLPSSTTFSSPITNEQLSNNSLLVNQHISINLPDEFNIIGLIDGQHRVYSYHEGNDVYENTISKLRKCQNLLVTAIMYPSDLSELDRTKFEATLFLEINDKQSKAKGDLKQAIELIVRPFSTTAISKAIIAQLAKNGPLKNLIEENYFDDSNKIKTSSIVSYGLKPLIKFTGNDSLMSIWEHQNKQNIILENDVQLLKDYIEFCVSEINKLLIAFKQNISKEKWSRENKELTVLSPTTINGLIVCLRELIKNGQMANQEVYAQKLIGLDSFEFKKFKSSNWNQLGLSIYDEFFKKHTA